MIARLTIDGVETAINLAEPIRIALPIVHNGLPNAFHLPRATFEPFRIGSFVGSIEEGGPVRCDVVTLAPHGNGTHTECVGHIAGRRYLITECMADVVDRAQLVTVMPAEVDGDGVITREALANAWSAGTTTTLVLRTTAASNATMAWSGTNPPYVHPDAMRLIVERGVRHLLIDLPSVDREEDGGALASHHIFWNWPEAPRVDCTITELIDVPPSVADGMYVVMFNVAAFAGDAAPSNPMLFRQLA